MKAATRTIGRSGATLLLRRNAAVHNHFHPHGPQGGPQPLSHAAALHTYALGGGSRSSDDQESERRRRQQQQPRLQLVERCGYHTSARNDRTAVTLILGFGALSATSYAAATAVRAWKDYQASLPDEPPPVPQEEEQQQQKQQQQQQAETNNNSNSSSTSSTRGEGPSAGPSGNFFTEWFGVGVGVKYYEGGFDDKMTRREAALILGVRESSDPKRIKDAHRKLLILNHPDTGGSTYLSGKINEAKEMLIKGRMR